MALSASHLIVEEFWRTLTDVWGCLLMHSSQAEVRILTGLLQHFKSFFFYTSAPLANDHLITCI